MKNCRHPKSGITALRPYAMESELCAFDKYFYSHRMLNTEHTHRPNELFEHVLMETILLPVARALANLTC